MEAKEYYERYGSALIAETDRPPSERTVLWAVMLDFILEASDLIRAKHCSIPKTARAVITAQNNKWNTLCAFFTKSGWRCPLKKDAFLTYAKEKLPELYEKGV